MPAKRRYRMLLDELDAVHNKVKNLLPNGHRLTEGEWRESVLRSVLRQHLPSRFLPLRGFVTDGSVSSRQIDLLLFDSEKPALFRDGDLVIATPDSAAVVAEVKTTIRSVGELKAALEPLAETASMIRSADEESDTFAGLFAFNTSLDEHRHLREVLDCLQEVQDGQPGRVVDMVSLGRNTFVLYWDGVARATNPSEQPDRRWWAYHLKDLAPGYFMSNVIASAAPSSVGRNLAAWFPEEPPDFNGLVRQEDVGSGVVVHEVFKAAGY